MLEHLRIQNFKSWQHTGDMAFGSLAGFFGTNSPGKRSFLHLLLRHSPTLPILSLKAKRASRIRLALLAFSGCRWSGGHRGSACFRGAQSAAL